MPTILLTLLLTSEWLGESVASAVVAVLTAAAAAAAAAIVEAKMRLHEPGPEPSPRLFTAEQMAHLYRLVRHGDKMPDAVRDEVEMILASAIMEDKR